MTTENKPKAAILSRILSYDLPENYTADDLYSAQLNFLSTDAFSIDLLLSNYSLCPDVIADTFALFYDFPEMTSLGSFPLSLLYTSIETGGLDSVSLVRQLCERRPAIYTNILYRYGYIDKETPEKYFSNLRLILSFKSCWRHLESRELWGLDRPRAGVSSKADKNILTMVKHNGLDITKVLDDGQPYVLPLFCQSAFCLVTGFDTSVVVTKNLITSVNGWIEQLYDCLSPLLGNPNIKNNFCDLIRNVYGQDRTKLKFKDEENCSDSFCYTLCIILMRVVGNTFNDSFIYQIDNKKFLTFCFFYIARMLQISFFRMAHNIMDEYNTKNLQQLIGNAHSILQSYLNFVYSVVAVRRDEVFALLLDKAREALPNDTIPSVNSLLTLHTTIPVFIDDSKATCIREILSDHAFIDSILTVQVMFNGGQIHKNAAVLMDALLGYKNPFKHLIVRILPETSIPISSMTVKRLLVLYNEKNNGPQVSHCHIHDIIWNQPVDPSHEALRMVTNATGKLEELLSYIFNYITKLIQTREKLQMLNRAFDEKVELSVSDDEMMQANFYTDEQLERLSAMGDMSIRAMISSRIQGNQPEVERVFKEIKTLTGVRKSRRLIRIYKKVKSVEAHIGDLERSLKYYSYQLSNMLKFLHSFTNINKRLFLNKHVFFRLFSNINSALNLLVGEQSLKIKLPNKEEYNFNPKEILAQILRITVNMLSRNSQLIQVCRLDRGLLIRAVELARNKLLLGNEHLVSLADILRELLEVTVEQVIDEDVPDDFLDPLTFAMMDDPVTMLTSKITIDRSTFNQIMLNDQIDPFSRLPLDDTKIVENTELKERIEAFKSSEYNPK